MKPKMKWKKRREITLPSPLAKPVDMPPTCPSCMAGRHDQCILLGGQRCGCTHAMHQEYPDPIEVKLHLKKHGLVVHKQESEPTTFVKSHSQIQSELTLFPTGKSGEIHKSRKFSAGTYWLEKVGLGRRSNKKQQ